MIPFLLVSTLLVGFHLLNRAREGRRILETLGGME
jgi:hypothetical protein